MTLRDDFLNRFYHWSLRQWDREVDSGLTTLAGLGLIETDAALSLIRPLPPPDRREYGYALVRRYHRRREVGRFDPTQVAAEYLARTREVHAARLMAPDAPLRAHNRVPARVLWKSIESRLMPVLGVKPEHQGGGSYCYSMAHEGLVIQTLIDVGGRYKSLLYFHRIRSDMGEIIGDAVSYCSWMGLSGGTMWLTLTPDQCEKTAQDLARLCAWFVEEVPSLLSDGPPPHP